MRAVIASIFMSCSPKAFVELTVNDPVELATTATTLAAGATLIDLDAGAIDDLKFPIKMILTASEPTRRGVWVEASGSNGVLGRGRVEVNIKSGGSIASVALLAPCGAAESV